MNVPDGYVICAVCESLFDEDDGSECERCYQLVCPKCITPFYCRACNAILEDD